MKARLSWLLVSAVMPMLACGGGGGTKAQGGVGQACYPNGTCNAGLSCFSKLCVDVNGDGAAGASGSAGAGTAGSGSAGATGSAGADAAAGASGSAGVDGGVDAIDAPASETNGMEAGAAAEAGADASTFSIAALPGLVLWLDAAKGVTAANGSVSTWKDQSTNGNDATTPQGASPAVLVTSAIANLPAVELGLTSQMDTQPANGGVATLGFGTGDVLVEEVAKWSSAAPSTILFATYTGSGMNQTQFLTLVGDSSGHAVGGEGDGAISVSSSSATLGDGSFHLVGVRRMGTSANATLEVRVNGAIEATSTGSMYGSDLGSLGVAAIGLGMPLQIAEVVVVKGSTSADDLAHLEAYLTSKYALP